MAKPPQSTTTILKVLEKKGYHVQSWLISMNELANVAVVYEGSHLLLDIGEVMDIIYD